MFRICFYKSFFFPSSFALFPLDLVSKFTVVFGFLLLYEFFYCRFFCSQLPWDLYISVYKQDCFKFLFFFFNFKSILNILHLLALLTITGLDIIFLHRWFTKFTVYVCLYQLAFPFIIFLFLIVAFSFAPRTDFGIYCKVDLVVLNSAFASL